MNTLQTRDGPDQPKIHEDAFWRDRVCEALGLPQNSDNSAIFDAMSTHMDWRERAARVLGVSCRVSSADLLAAHEKHMAGLKRVNEAAASIQNSKARQNLACSLVNVLVNRGLKYDAAFASVRASYPNLIKS